MKPYEIILEQLGGNKFVAMTGAKLMHDGDYILIAKIKGSRIYNQISIFLNGLDLYDITFKKIGTIKTNFRTIVEKIYKDVYAENMKNIIESETGLYISL